MQHKAIIGLVVLTVVGVALWGIVNNTQAYAEEESPVNISNLAVGQVNKNQTPEALSAKVDFPVSPARLSAPVTNASGPQVLSVFSLPVDLRGSITAMGVDGLVVETMQGEVAITGSEWAYLLRQGFSATVGDELQLEGFYEKEEFLVSLIGQMNDGSLFLLRDATGQLVRGVGS